MTAFIDQVFSDALEEWQATESWDSFRVTANELSQLGRYSNQVLRNRWQNQKLLAPRHPVRAWRGALAQSMLRQVYSWHKANMDAPFTANIYNERRALNA